MRLSVLFLFSLFITLTACRKRSPEELKARSEGKFKLHLPFEKDGKLMAVIESSAGDHHKTNYNPINHAFEKLMIDDQLIKTKHLSLPFNAGFIPSTRLDTNKRGNGETVKVFVLSGRIPSETYTPINPIGLMHYNDKGIKRTVVLAHSLDDEYQSIKSEDISLLPKGVLEMVSNWVCNQESNDRYQLISWGQQRDALKYINDWKLRR